MCGEINVHCATVAVKCKILFSSAENKPWIKIKKSISRYGSTFLVEYDTVGGRIELECNNKLFLSLKRF